MALPTVQKKWIIQGGQKGLDEIHFVEGPVPKVDDYGVLVKLHAAGLNPRDFGIATPGVSLIFTQFSIFSPLSFHLSLHSFANNCFTRSSLLLASTFRLLVDQMALVKLSQWAPRSQSGS